MINLSTQKSFINLLFGGVLLFLMGLNSSCHKEVFQTDFRTIVPLKISYDTLQGHEHVTPSVVVNINGEMNEVIFDTGSNGLRMLRGALHGAAVDSDKEWVSVGYGFTTPYFYIRGNVTGGDFSIGGLSNHNSLRFMSITSTSTVGANGPWTSTLDSDYISNGHFQHLAGVMGVGMRLGSKNNGIANPLAQLPGNGSYIVEFPMYKGSAGQVIINPNNNEITGFTMFHLQPDSTLLPNGFNSWQDNMLNGTIIVDGNTVNANTLLDTGNPVIDASASNLPGNELLGRGGTVTMQLAAIGQNTPLISSSFTVSTATSGKDRVVIYKDTVDKPRIVFGINIFFLYDVFFDQQNGEIGLRKKKF